MSISRTHEDVLADFHSQIEHILNGYQSPTLDASKYHNLVIGGLGGSGIGGRIARLVFLNSSPIPVEVYSEYALPAYASNKTLVILSSYSGNTEETLAMYADAKKRGCDIIVLSSGGKITDMAQADGFPVYGSPFDISHVRHWDLVYQHYCSFWEIYLVQVCVVVWMLW